MFLEENSHWARRKIPFFDIDRGENLPNAGLS